MEARRPCRHLLLWLFFLSFFGGFLFLFCSHMYSREMEKKEKERQISMGLSTRTRSPALPDNVGRCVRTTHVYVSPNKSAPSRLAGCGSGGWVAQRSISAPPIGRHGHVCVGLQIDLQLPVGAVIRNCRDRPALREHVPQHTYICMYIHISMACMTSSLSGRPGTIPNQNTGTSHNDPSEHFINHLHVGNANLVIQVVRNFEKNPN